MATKRFGIGEEGVSIFKLHYLNVTPSSALRTIFRNFKVVLFADLQAILLDLKHKSNVGGCFSNIYLHYVKVVWRGRRPYVRAY